MIQSSVYYWDAPYQRVLDDCFDTIICLLLGCSLSTSFGRLFDTIICLLLGCFLSTSFGRLFWYNHLFITGMLLINDLWTIVLIQSSVYYWDAPYQRALDDCFDTIICLLLGCSLSTSFRRLFWYNHLFITVMLLINELWTIVLIQSSVYYWDAPYQRALDDCFDTIICLLLGCSLSTSFRRLFWYNHLFITGMLLINELWTIVLIQSSVYYWDAPYQRALDDCFDTIICLLLGCSLSTSFRRLFWYNHLFITGMLLINELWTIVLIQSSVYYWDAPYQRALDDCFDTIICLLLGCSLSTSFRRLFWYNHLFITGMLFINELWTIVLIQSSVYYWDAPYQRALDDCFDTIICLLLGCSLSTSFRRLFWCNHLFITGMLFINELWTIVLIQSSVYYWDTPYQRALDDCFDTIICLLLGCSLSMSFKRLFWYNHLFITGMLLINKLWTIVLIQSSVYYWNAPYQRALDDCFDTIICLLLGCSLSTSFGRLFWYNHLFITGMLLINKLWTIVLIQSSVYYWNAPYQWALDDCFDTIICLLLGCSLSTSFGRLFWYNHLFITGMLLINELWTIVLIQSFVYYWNAPYQRALDDCFDIIICLLLGCSLSMSFGRLFWYNNLFITGMLLINELWTIVLIQSFVYYWDALYQWALDDCFDTIICLLLGCFLSTSFGRLFW